MSEIATEPLFYDDWYDLGIRSIDSSEDGGPLGNQAYYDWMKRVIDAATGRDIDWTHIDLAIVLDRMLRQDEARRAADHACTGAYCTNCRTAKGADHE